jgi:hypothetical protein
LLEVYGINSVYLGEASNFGEAKRMQKASLPDDLKEVYAGYHDGGPLFYSEFLTPELLKKYPQLDHDGNGPVIDFSQIPMPPGSYDRAIQDAKSLAKATQRTADVRSTKDGRYYETEHLNALIDGHTHVATVHQDGRVDQV